MDTTELSYGQPRLTHAGRVYTPDEGPTPTRPSVRRRTIFDRKRRAIDDDPRVQGQLPLSSSIRVISPSDVTSPNASFLRLAQHPTADSSTLCVNTVLFAFGIALIFALLVSSCVTSALLCIRQRGISKKDRELYDYDSSPLPDYPK